MKAYTDLEQSKKLAKILSVDSADMFYNEEQDETHPKDIVDTKYPMVIREGQKYHLEEYGIPCWSLAALIDVLPLGISIQNISDGHKIYYYVEIYTKEIYMKLKRMNKEEICLSTQRHENLIDACVEMIVKLKEKDLL